MRAGRLRRRISIQQWVETEDASGSMVGSYQAYLTCRAEVKPIRASEQFRAQKETAETTHLVTLRYSSLAAGITANMRVLFDDRVLDLIAPPVNVGERNRVIELQCKESV